MSNERLIQLVKKHALQIAVPGTHFVLKSGKKSSYYLDLRQLHLCPEGLHEVVLRLWQEMMPLQFDAFGGPCVGADPIIGGLTFYAGVTAGAQRLRGFLIRKEEKDHGIRDRIIGTLKGGDRCVLVEDVITTAGSVLEAVDVVEGLGADVIQVFGIVDRLSGGAEAFAARGIPYKPLVTIKELDFPNG